MAKRGLEGVICIQIEEEILLLRSFALKITMAGIGRLEHHVDIVRQVQVRGTPDRSVGSKTSF